MNGLVQMQVFYEIAMDIGVEANLENTARKGLSAYLHRLGCMAGVILRTDQATGAIASLVVLPRTLGGNPVYTEHFNSISAAIAEGGLPAFLARLPLTGVLAGKSYYITELKGFGMLILFKKGEPYDQTVLHGINRLNQKLAQVCLASLYAENLERSVEERTGDLWKLNAELLVVNARLKDSLDNVKTLSGLLPICASCKKIRDDKGYWNKIENYVRSRTNAEFTHSICPECAKRLYPEYHADHVDNPDDAKK